MTVTNRDIYKNALSLIGERVSEDNCDDYEERAEYILPVFFSIAKSIDKKIRKTEGKPTQPKFSAIHAALEDEFPLLECFASPASLYLAAILVIEADHELADSLYDKYCDGIASIAAYTSCESISQKYFFN